MELIPAIDIRHGKCVRLVQGDPDRETQYDTSPLEVVRQYSDAGVSRIHLVDLDGAIEGTTSNEGIIREIVRESDMDIELGGGIRSLKRIAFWLNTGVSQVILGTVAVREPELVEEAVERFGSGSIIVGIDVKTGKVATHGWKETSDLTANRFASQMEKSGVERFIFTAIETDGMMKGPNMKALQRFAAGTRGSVTASGGVRNLNDLLALTSLEQYGVDSAIVGKAIYEGALDVAEAVERLGEA